MGMFLSSPEISLEPVVTPTEWLAAPCPYMAEGHLSSLGSPSLPLPCIQPAQPAALVAVGQAQCHTLLALGDY